MSRRGRMNWLEAGCKNEKQKQKENELGGGGMRRGSCCCGETPKASRHNNNRSERGARSSPIVAEPSSVDDRP